MLAYGQSGAGKSYTMGTSGPTDQYDKEVMGKFCILPLVSFQPKETTQILFITNPTLAPKIVNRIHFTGVIPRAATALFEKLGDPKPSSRHSMPILRSNGKSLIGLNSYSNTKNLEKSWSLRASYVEIYNEQLRDLLVPDTTPSHERPTVIIREDVKGHIILTGLHQVDINCIEDMMSALSFGSMIRQTDSTSINAKSSRSHAVFSLNLIQHKIRSPDNSSATDKTFSELPDEKGMITIDSKFHFVDLAGSERLKNTGAQGERAKEGISINAGLASLGKVISQLSSRQAGAHVSFRDSKLTRLLQDSLGGNAVTYMIACVTPVEFHLSETLNTVQYAQRARAIQSKPRIQHVSDGTDKLAQIKRLKAEIAYLRDQIGNTEHRNNWHSDAKSINRSDGQSEREIELQNQLLDIQENYNALSQRHAIVIAEMAKSRDNELANSDAFNSCLDEHVTERLERSSSFVVAVENVVLEYEKTIQSLEKSLSNSRNSLSNAENAIHDKETKLALSETLNQQLQARLQKLADREHSTEYYLQSLETKLNSHTSGEEKNSAIVMELRKEIARVRENEAACEDYISTLEERLAEADQDTELMQREIDRLEQVVERQWSLGKLDCLVYELDHIHKDGRQFDETQLVNGGSKLISAHHAGHQSESGMKSLQTVTLKHQVDNERAASDLAIKTEVEGSADQDDVADSEERQKPSQSLPKTSYSLPSPAQTKYVEDKLESVSQELFDLRVEHESTLNEYEILSTKYEEAIRTLSQLQDSVEEARHSGITSLVFSNSMGGEENNPAIPSESKIHSSDNSKHRSLLTTQVLSSELISAGEMLSFPTCTNTPTSEFAEDSPNSKNEAALIELKKLKNIVAGREISYRVLADNFKQLEKEHISALELADELKAEVSKAKMNQVDNVNPGYAIIRRKSSQNLMSIDKAHRALVSLRSIGSEYLESNPDVYANFQLNLNTAVHELHVRSERVQELEADITAAKKEIDAKMVIIAGLTRERSSLQSSPLDISVVSSMREKLLERENQIKEAHQYREQELLRELNRVRASLDAITSSNDNEKKASALNEEDADLKQKISLLEVENSHLKQKNEVDLKTFENTKQELLDTIADLGSQAAKICHDKLRENETDDPNEVSAMSPFEIVESTVAPNAETSILKNLEDSCTLAQEQFNQSSKSRDDALSEVRHQQTLITKLQYQIVEYEKTIDTFQKDLSRLREIHEQEIRDLKHNRDSVAKAHLSELSKTYLEEISQLQAEISRVYDKFTSIASNISAAIGAEIGKEELEEKILNLLSERETLLKESDLCQKMKKDTLELMTNNDNLSRELEMTKAELFSMINIISDGSKRIGVNSMSDHLAYLRKEISDLASKNDKNSRLVQELEDQLASNYEQHQVFNNRLSILQSEHTAQIEETNVANARVRAELDIVKEEYLSLQVSSSPIHSTSTQLISKSKYDEKVNLEQGTKITNQNGQLKKSSSVTSLPSPPPAIPLPPLPAVASNSSLVHRSVSPIPNPTNQSTSKDLAAQQIHEEQEARIRTIEKHLSTEKQLTQTLEEALTDLEKQSKKLKSDSDIWKKRCVELELEVKDLREKEKNSKLKNENRWSMLQVEEERKKRRDAEVARAQLEERMNAISKKKKKASLNCF